MPHPMRHAQGFPQCHWTLLPGECLRHIARVATMVINVACGPMAYKTQLLAYLLPRKPIVVFCDGMKKIDMDDINDKCSIFNMKIL
jgi:hypothetical protein